MENITLHSVLDSIFLVVIPHFVGHLLADEVLIYKHLPTTIMENMHYNNTSRTLDIENREIV